jgi:SulP family sulfate permease
LAPDLDHALEACEEEIIAGYTAEGGGRHSLREWPSQALGGQPAQQCKRLDVAKDEFVATQGSPADCMHFIVEGRVGVIVTMDDGRSIRVRSLGPHNTIGEIGLITKRQRSATIQAEVPSVYALSADAYERLKSENPRLSQALLTYTVTVMA